MKTKVFAYITAGMLAATGFASCSDNWTADIEGEGEGMLNTSSILPTVKNEESILNDDKGVLKVKGAPSRASYNISSFLVDVTGADNNVVESWTYSAMPSLPTFKVGTYKVKVRSHEVQPAEWEKPYFVGEQSFAIKNGEVTDVPAIVCTLANVAVSVKFDDKLLREGNGGADFKVTVTPVTGGPSLVYTPAETRKGYFELLEGNTTIEVNFTGTVSGREENTTSVLTNVKPGELRKVTLWLKSNPNRPPEETGNIQVDGNGINVDFSVEETDLTGDIQNSETPTDPTYKPGEEGKDPTGGDDPQPPTPGDYKIEFETDMNLNGPNDAAEYGSEAKEAIVYISANKGIQHLIVNIESDFLTDEFLTEFGLAAEFDLANIPGSLDDEKSQLSILTRFGFPVNEQVVGKGIDEPLVFNITSFIPLIFEAGDHKFHITVIDMEGNERKETLLIRKS